MAIGDRLLILAYQNWGAHALIYGMDIAPSPFLCVVPHDLYLKASHDTVQAVFSFGINFVWKRSVILALPKQTEDIYLPQCPKQLIAYHSFFANSPSICLANMTNFHRKLLLEPLVGISN